MTKETKNKPTHDQRDLEAKYLRAMADYQNLEKRVEREKDNFIKFANALIILKFLPVLDNLERAGAHLKDQGIDLVIKQFKEALSSEGVTEINSAGTSFDPELHEAIEKVDGEEDKVISIVQSGYKMGDKVIRPAKVTVGGKK